MNVSTAEAREPETQRVVIEQPKVTAEMLFKLSLFDLLKTMQVFSTAHTAFPLFMFKSWQLHSVLS